MMKSLSRILVMSMFAWLLNSCSLFSSVQQRLLTIDYYHVRFEPSSPSLTPTAREAESMAWRAAVRSAAMQVQASVSANSVYGDASGWDTLLDSPANATVTQCRARNDDSKSLRITPGPNDSIAGTTIRAAAGDLSHIDLPGVGPCNIGSSRRIRTIDIITAALAAGVPTSSFTTLEIRLGDLSNTTPWKALDMATLSATYTPGSPPGNEQGSAQFAFLVLPQNDPGWQNEFEEVIIVTRGSYIGDVKI